ncbi:hypothetical protein P7M57_23855, partial [Vibrio parahaemolyticus]|nr:hypothetical protein [Vibrio parahaemolyticus]
EALILKLPWRAQDAKDAQVVRYLQRRAADREWNQPRAEKFVAVNKDEKGAGDLKTAVTSDMETQGLEFAQLDSCLALGITVK